MSRRQPTIRLHNLCLEDLTIHGNDVRLVFDQVIFPTLPINALAVLQFSKIFNLDWVFIWDSNINPPDDSYVLCHIADSLCGLIEILEHFGIS